MLGGGSEWGEGVLWRFHANIYAAHMLLNIPDPNSGMSAQRTPAGDLLTARTQQSVSGQLAAGAGPSAGTGGWYHVLSVGAGRHRLWLHRLPRF